MDLTPGQFVFPYAVQLELESCSIEALDELHELLTPESIPMFCSRRSAADLEQLMVAADALIALLLAP